ncbi:ribonuclease H-like domain-containing protein, partial [Tanacetum coccineum]
SEEENVSQTKIEKKTAKPSFDKIDFVKAKQTNKTDRKTAKQVEHNRQNTHIPRGNQRNWNNMMSQRLGSNFEMFNKACYMCESFDHLHVDCNYQRVVKPIWNNAKRVNHKNFAKKTHPCLKKNMVLRAVLIKSGLVSVKTARQNILKTAVLVNTARQVNAAHSKTTVNVARPMSYLSKTTHSTIKRPIYKNTAFKNSNFKKRVNIIKDNNVNIARPKGNNVNAVKASACWVWKPKTKVLDHGNPQMDLQDKGVIDSGCTRHMKGGKIIGKDDGSKPLSDDEKKVDEDPRKDSKSIDQEKDDNVNSTNNVNVASTNEVNDVEDVGAEADMNNLDTTIQVSPILTTRIHKDHPLNQVIGDLQLATQTRNMSKNLEEHGKNPKRLDLNVALDMIRYEAWDIVGNDVMLVVRKFFINGKLLKELNHTIIALIPKVSSPARVNDFRPISCCNVLFKCVSKIIANRIKSSLKGLISPNQSAFVPGRSISDNILLTQELMYSYHLNHGSPRCAFKVDIQKAYDMLELVNLCFVDDLFLFPYGNASSASGKAKVAWEVVCLPKDEGGSELLWVQWIHAYKLRGRSFWDIPFRGNTMRGWRNVLKLRPIIKEFVWNKIGDGSSTFIWYDRWCLQSPLADVVSSWDIFRKGFSKNTKVCDLVRYGSLNWPNFWLSKYPILNSLPSPTLVPGSQDVMEWRNEVGWVKAFSAHAVWSTIHPQGSKDNAGSLNMACSLCESKPDSHEHLFFECAFSQHVWSHLNGFAGLPNITLSINEIINDILPFAARKTSKSIIAKLVLAAATYFIWQERNGRLFKNSKRTVNQVIEYIMNSVRLKLLSCRLKKTRSALDLVKACNLSEAICS